MSAFNSDLEEGVRLVKEGRAPEAVTHLRMAIINQPGNPKAHEFLGAAFAFEGDTESAILELKEAVRLSPGNAAYHYNLGQAYETAGRYDMARDAYQSSLNVNPGYARARAALATVSRRSELEGAA